MWRPLAPAVLVLCFAACRWTVGPPPETCVPVPSQETRTRAAGWGERSWMDQVEDIQKAIEASDPKLVLIGDSITQSWGGGGRQVGGAGGAAREQWLEPLGPLVNAGISGDRTQHVFWRIETGKMQGMAPEAVVLMIGTNNLPHDSAEDIAAGTRLILEQLREDLPEARLILLSCPPRGEMPDQELRQKGAELNEQAARIADELGVEWLDLMPLLVDTDGRARGDRMAKDFVHFSAAGYQAIGEALHARLAPSDLPR